MGKSGGLSKAEEKLRNAPQLAFARLFPEVLKHVMSIEPFGLGLEIIRNVLLKIFQRHEYSPNTARTTCSNHCMGASEPVPRV